MSDGAAALGLFMFGVLFGAWLVFMPASCAYQLRGRCVELCRPESYLERIGDECICKTMRVKLEKVP